MFVVYNKHGRQPFVIKSAKGRMLKYPVRLVSWPLKYCLTRNNRTTRFYLADFR